MPESAIPGSDHDSRSIAGAVLDRFGISAEVLAPYELRRTGRRYIVMCRIGDLLPSGLPSAEKGIPIVRVNLRYPKLTTAAVMLFGHQARRNILDVGTDGARRYARGEDARFDSLPDRCTSPGYVMVRWSTHAIGVGLLLEESGAYRLKSLFPRRWAPVGGQATPGGSET